MALKNLFIKDEREPRKTTPSSPNESGSVPIPTAPIVSTITGVADEKFVEMLTGIIAQNNIPGQDYFEFKQTIDAMSSLPIDERTKFLTVFTTFNLQGCTKQLLIESIDKYIALVKSEKENFDGELQSHRNTNITSKVQEIEHARKRVEQLNQEISDLNTFIITTGQEVQSNELKLQMTEANFNQSVEKVVGLLSSDKEKINLYIQ